MAFTISAESNEDAFLEGLAYFADELIERDQATGLYNPSAVKDQILWTVQRALEDMELTHF